MIDGYSNSEGAYRVTMGCASERRREMVVDVARQYQPPARLRGVVDAMVASKLNVLHLHLTDRRAFLAQSAAYPKLWRGAYPVARAVHAR